jgi:hypothetical protein
LIIFICNIPFLFCAAKLAVLSIISLCHEKNDKILDEKSEGYEMESIAENPDIYQAKINLSPGKDLNFQEI